MTGCHRAIVGCVLMASLASAPALAGEGAKQYVGTVLQVNGHFLSLQLDGSQVDIGFKCLPDACTYLTRVIAGDRIEAIFDDRDIATNTLVAVRHCSSIDTACDQVADRQRQRTQETLAQYHAMAEAELHENEELTALFRLNRQQLAGLPECWPRRQVLHIDVSSLGEARAASSATASYIFEIELGPEGKARNIALESGETEISSVTKALYHSLSTATFDKSEARCRQEFRMTIRQTD